MHIAAGRGAWQPQEGLAAETTMDCNPDIAETGKMSTDEEKLVSGAGERLAMFLPENCATCVHGQTHGG